MLVYNKMGIIYKLKVGDYFYIGRTTSHNVNTRWSSHKKACFNTSKKGYWCKVYKKFRELGVRRHNWDDMVVKTVVYDKVDNDYIYCYEYLCINIDHPLNLNTQSDKNITEIYKKVLKKWGTRTKEDIKEYHKKYRKEHIKQHREYIKENKEKNKEKHKKYIDEHKKEILEYKLEKIECECCKTQSMRVNMKRHQKSKLCLSYQKWLEVD